MSTDSSSTPSPRSVRTAPLLALAGLAVFIVAAGYAFTHRRPQELVTSNAKVIMESSPLVPEVGGTVTEVLVTDGQEVRKGDTIAKLDATPYASAVKEAQTILAAAENDAKHPTAAATLGGPIGGGVPLPRPLPGQGRPAPVPPALASQAVQSHASLQSAQAKVVQAQAAVKEAQASLSRAEVAAKAAESSIASSNLALSRAKADVGAAEVAVEPAHQAALKAEAEAKRQQGLYDQGLTAKNAAQTAASKAADAGTAFRSAEERLRTAQAVVTSREGEIRHLTDLRDAARKSAEAARLRVKTSQDALAKAQSAVTLAESQAKSSEESLRRAQSVRRFTPLFAAPDVAPVHVDYLSPTGPAAVNKVNDAKKALEQAQAKLKATVLVAPADGVVRLGGVTKGSRIEAGKASVFVIPAGALRISASFPRSVLPRISVGDRATIYPSFSAAKIPASVDSVALDPSDATRVLVGVRPKADASTPLDASTAVIVHIFPSR